MCEFCDRSDCQLTKKEVVERGPILEDNTYGIMRFATEETPQTYSFDGVPAYYSLSALIPDGGEEDPHMYLRYVFDEDTGCDGNWESRAIFDPLGYRTEKEVLKGIGK